MIIRACWHTHAPLLPFFDWKNRRYAKAIDQYLENLKREGINAIAITTHVNENLRNPKLNDKVVSFFKNNINPRTIYKVIEGRAKLKGITVFPALEVEVFLCQKLPARIHLGIVHWNEEEIYQDLSRFVGKTLEELLQVVPKGSVVDIKHPWYRKHGITGKKTYRILKHLVDKYHLLIEKNGLASIAYIFTKHLLRLFPLIGKNKLFLRKFIEIKQSVNLEGFKNSFFTCGSDAHSASVLPKGGGYIQLKLNQTKTTINKKQVIEYIKQGQGKVVLPKKMSFWQAGLFLLRSFFALRKEEIILFKILQTKKALRKKIYWESLKSQPNYKKIIFWLNCLNEGFNIYKVLPPHLIFSLEKKQFQNKLILNFQKLISLSWERKFAFLLILALYFIIRKIVALLIY